MAEETIYRLQQVVRAYGTDFRLHIHDLYIGKGESVGIVGHNGSGKSTLLRILAFLDRVDEGEIIFSGSSDREITMLLQHPYLFKRTVFENVAFGLKVRQKREMVKDRVRDSLALMGLRPAQFMHRRWLELSGGEAQRVALAARLVINPEVLILDEPTANVDQHSAALIKNAILQYRKKYNTTLVMTSHDIIWLNSVSDRVMRMHNGRIIGRGTDNLLHGPWEDEGEGLWRRVLPDGQYIHAVHPPHSDAFGVLNSSNIMLSTGRPDHISAQNVLGGQLLSMSSEHSGDRVRVEVHAGGLLFSCSVTHHAADTLKLLPGKDVWILFKASSIVWY
ncbi:MAG: ATP-binding cassette domain-containing protein [Spirochaetes bacterium]|nr:ATP-binding cassette domain-containing protein [Spirochaetota bacterium]